MERRSQRQSHLPYRPYQSRQSPPSPHARHHHHSPPSLHHSPPPSQRLSPIQPLSLASRMYLRGRDPLKDLQWNKDWFSYLLEENQILRDAILHLYANANLSLDLPLPPMSLAPTTLSHSPLHTLSLRRIKSAARKCLSEGENDGMELCRSLEPRLVHDPSSNRMGHKNLPSCSESITKQSCITLDPGSQEIVDQASHSSCVLPPPSS